MDFIVILLIMGIAVYVQNTLYRRKSFSKLSYRCYFSTQEASEGDEITLVEEIINNKLLPLPWLKAELTTSKWLDFAGSQSLITDETRFVPSFFVMKSFHKVVRNWKVKCTKRGVYDLNKVVLVSTDLFGNVNTSKLVQVNQRLTVLPGPVDILCDLDSPRHLSGDHIVRRQVVSDPFMIAGVREYTERDPMNKIHWPSSARMGQLMVHNNEFTASQSLAVILNVQSRPYETRDTIDADKIETAIKVCAGYFDDTLRTGIPVQLYTNAGMGDTGTPIITNEYWGPEHVLDLLRMLAGIQLRSTETFRNFLSGSCRGIRSSDLVLVTAYLSEDIYDYAFAMQNMGAQVKIIFIGKIEEGFHVPDSLSVFEYLAKGGVQ